MSGADADTRARESLEWVWSLTVPEALPLAGPWVWSLVRHCGVMKFQVRIEGWLPLPRWWVK